MVKLCTDGRNLRNLLVFGSHLWSECLYCVIVSTEYTFAALPRTARGTPLVLGGDPKGKTFLYTNGNSVIIRDIENPAVADVYTEHSCQVNVAKYSPSGFYIASGGKYYYFIL